MTVWQSKQFVGHFKPLLTVIFLLLAELIMPDLVFTMYCIGLFLGGNN